MFLFVENNFGKHHPNNFKKSQKLSKEISALEFCYSYAIAFKYPWNFTYVSEASDFMELFYYDSRNFAPDLGLFSTISKFKHT